MYKDHTTCEHSQSYAPSHTPGPWRADERAPVSGVPSEQSKIPFAITRPDTGYCTPIADVCAFPPSTLAQVETMRANARLIAAAPLLLKACKRAVNDVCDADGTINNFVIGLETIEQLRAAINAAQGNSGSGDLK